MVLAGELFVLGVAVQEECEGGEGAGAEGDAEGDAYF